MEVGGSNNGLLMIASTATEEAVGVIQATSLMKKRRDLH